MIIYNNRGISLVEVIVSLLILVLIGFSLLHSHLANRQTTRMATYKMMATDVLQSQMEIAKSLPYEDIDDVAEFDILRLEGEDTPDFTDDIWAVYRMDVTDNGDNSKTLDSWIWWIYRVHGEFDTTTISLSTVVSGV